MTTIKKIQVGLKLDKELLIKMLLKNQEVMEKMMEIIPTIGNVSHNNSHNTINNTTNNQFNIQMFLNDHCKNAMNLTDFIDTLPITSETYDSTIDNGLTKTITNMITNGLSQLDILEETDPLYRCFQENIVCQRRQCLGKRQRINKNTFRYPSNSFQTANS